MNSFTLGATEFGIDISKSKIKISVPEPQFGVGLLNLDVSGDASIFDELSSQEGSEWSWALYPPALYFHEIPIQLSLITSASEFAFEVDNNLEYGLYMMEHCNIKALSVAATQDRQIRIGGLVDFWGKTIPFSVTHSFEYAT